MNNIYTDKYFTKAKKVAEANDMNPIVKYRVFGRFNGMSALAPARLLIKTLAPNAFVTILPEGTLFEAGDTIMTIEGRFQEIVELETQYLQWSALPCYCAYHAYKIIQKAEGKEVLDFSARHLFGEDSVALASYGASVAGVKKFSTDIGANAFDFLKIKVNDYKLFLSYAWSEDLKIKGIGTIPHALLTLFHGDYIACANAYEKAYPKERQIHLIDYNNKEIEDSLALFKHLGDKLQAVRIDTCGENHAQIGREPELFDTYKGVSPTSVVCLRGILNSNGAKNVEIIVSSGFDEAKTEEFMTHCSPCFSVIGTGSFIPKLPQCTSDIFLVDGKPECKVGRAWGYVANTTFYMKTG